VRRLTVEESDARSRPNPRPTGQPIAPEPQPQSHSTLDVIVVAFTGLGYALSARMLLLLSLIGAFILAVMAMKDQTLPGLEVLIAYAVFTVIPVAYLEIRRRQ
jgi:hypothetical protein